MSNKPKKRAMSSAAASLKKIAGHITEYDFAEIIGGSVNKGDQKAKKDVIDQQHNTHSVKGGTWWQVFLYGRNRLKTNTILQGLGEIAPILIECLDAFPDDYTDYQKDKASAKIALQNPMTKLCAELKKPRMLKAFLDKALFNGGEVNYLTVKDKNNVFHIFENNFVTTELERFEVANSKARQKGQFDAQKTVLKHKGINIGEIELRNDSRQHYREAKFRLNGEKVLAVLLEAQTSSAKKTNNVIAYNNAIKKFSI